jgi:hypothetical protein
VGTDGALSTEPGGALAEPEDLAAVEYLARPEDPNLVCYIPAVYGPVGACSPRDLPLPVPPPQHVPPP